MKDPKLQLLELDSVAQYFGVDDGSVRATESETELLLELVFLYNFAINIMINVDKQHDEFLVLTFFQSLHIHATFGNGTIVKTNSS